MSKEASWQNRIDTLKEQVGRLLAGREIRWKDIDYSFWKSIPKKPGVYVVIEEGCYIYVGISKNLRNRLQVHGRGNRSGDAFNDKLYKVRHISLKKDREKFVKDRCSFKFLEVVGKKGRCNLEHFTIAVLNPELND